MWGEILAAMWKIGREKEGRADFLDFIQWASDKFRDRKKLIEM